jgi:thioesterase domain-containing protein
MGTERPFLGLRQTPDNRPGDTIADMAARCVAAMLKHQPTGPFYLGGHSLGATVAFEMTHQLLKQGHEIGLFAIIDQRRPGWRLTARNAWPVLHRILPTLLSRIRNELADVPPSQRGRKLLHMVLTWSKLLLGFRPKATSLFDFMPDQTNKVVIYDSNLRAARNYRPLALSAPIVLFRAHVQPLSNLALDETLGWSDLAKQEVRVHMVPGTHGSIVREPLVRELARAVTAELDAAQAARRQAKPAPPISRKAKEPALTV